MLCQGDNCRDWDDDEGRIPTDANEFIAWLQSKIALVPPGRKAKIKIDSESGYDGCHTLKLEVYYDKSS